MGRVKNLDINKSISNLFPEIAEEWNEEKNGELTPENTTPGSSKKVWWKCENGHEWEAIVQSRMRDGYGCPYCSKKRAGYGYSLGDMFPELCKEWNEEKNYDCSPFEITPFTGKKVWWKCEYNHEWEAIVGNRTRLGSGCPYCKGTKVGYGNSFGDNHPELAKEWNVSKNKSMTPFDFTPGSEKKMWWICEEGHEWQATITHRVNGTGCPYCIGRKVGYGNSLGDRYPDLSREWHPLKNKGRTPFDYTPGSRVKVWWQCKQDHEWKATISSRVTGNGCIRCSKRISSPIRILDYAFSKIFKDVKIECQIGQDTVDMLVTDLNLVIEYDSAFYHKNRVEHDSEKSIRIINEGFSLLRIRSYDNSDSLTNIVVEGVSNLHLKVQNTLTSIDDANLFIRSILAYMKETYTVKYRDEVIINSIEDLNILTASSTLFTKSLTYRFPGIAKQWHPTKNKGLLPSNMSGVAGNKVWWKCKEGHEWQANIDNRTSKNYGCPFCDGRRLSDETSLAHRYPELAKQWHPTKNGELTPYQVMPGTRQKVWWKCDDGHEWFAVVANRMNGCNCPYCSGQAIGFGNALGDMYKDLADEWNYDKNKGVSPFEIRPQTNKKYWWVCSKGHEWDAVPSSRVRGAGCPYCAGKRAGYGNTLGDIYPVLALEWHPTMNGEKTPYDVAPTSNKKVWWLNAAGREWEAIISNRARPYRKKNMKKAEV